MNNYKSFILETIKNKILKNASKTNKPKKHKNKQQINKNTHKIQKMKK